MVTALLLAGVLLLWPVLPRPLVQAPVPPAPADRGAMRSGRWGARIRWRRWTDEWRAGARRGRGRWVRGSGAVLCLATGLGVAAAAGPAPGVAAAMVIGTGLRLARNGLDARRARRVRAGAVAALRALVRELRAGAPPELAARTAAPPAGPVAEVLLAATSGLPAVSMGVLPHWPAATPASWPPARRPAGPRTGRRSAAAEVLVPVYHRLAAAWWLSARHGVALAALVETLADDLDRAAVNAADLATTLAGPRLSGYLLAGLPIFGLLLGAGMGTDPAHLLLATGIGGVLLTSGVALVCAGLLWVDRITRS